MAQANPITQAIKQICEEKHISYESVVETIEAALAVAYRKDFVKKEEQLNIEVSFDPETTTARVFDVKKVVEDEFVAEALKAQEEARLAAEAAAKAAEEAIARGETPVVPEPTPVVIPSPETPAEEDTEERYDAKSMIALAEAKKIKPDAVIGDEIRTELFPPTAYGRMAAQTAKQVIIQRLREAEREMVFNEYKDREGQLLNGTIQRVEGRLVFVDLGSATAIMPPGEQSDREFYRPGTRLKFYVVSVQMTPRGPEIVVSRSHPDMVRKLFELEVPEIASGAVEIRHVAREAGSRTKIAVLSTQKNIDPVGSCVGQRGTRVQTVIGELGGEKIDIIEWSDDAVKFITNSLSPAKVLSLKLDEENRLATVEVKEDQVSLAIGKSGQNVRLAAKLTGWKIDIIGEEGTVRPNPESPLEKTEDGAATPETAGAGTGETASETGSQEPEAGSQEAEAGSAGTVDAAPAEAPAAEAAPATEETAAPEETPAETPTETKS